MTTHPTYDVIVIGGGAAGLSGALALGRARRTVLVIDAGEPRNAPAASSHNYLGREGESPLELLRIGRAEVEQYGVEIVSGTAVTATRSETGFDVTLADGSHRSAARLLVTTGLVDELPDIPGLAERWGRDVLHCPYCHGWEVRDQAIGIIGSPASFHQALMWGQWSSNLTLFASTAPDFTDDEYEQLAARGVCVVADPIESVVVEGDALVGARLQSGKVIEVSALVVGPRFETRAGVLADLGAQTAVFEMFGHTIGSYVESDPVGLTSVPGVWVAGNVASGMETLIGSAAAGVRAGMVINGDLIAEEVKSAVDARRTRVTA